MKVAVRPLLALTIVAIEFAWAYPWVLLLSGTFYGASAAPLLRPAAAFALLVLPSLMVRTVAARPWWLRNARALVAAAGVLSGMTAVRFAYYPGRGPLDVRWIGMLLMAAHDALPAITPQVLAALLATVLWWRGVVLGERESGYFEVERAFRRGIGWSVVFVILLALYGDSRGFAPAASAPAYLLAFFSLSLTTLAVTRLLMLWEETHADPAQALAANRHWLLLLLGVVGVIFLSAASLATAVHVEVWPVLVRLLRPLAPVAETLFYVLFAVAMVVARALVFVFARLPFRGMGSPVPRAAPPSFRDLLKDLPPQVVSGARWGMVALVIAVLVILVAISVVRARRRARKTDDDERESVWSSEAVLSGLGEAWRRWLRQMRPTARGSELAGLGVIRTLYREMLRTGAAVGMPRARHQTPHEYYPVLAGRLPEAGKDIATLTEAYARARYSPRLPGPTEIAAAQGALERIKTSASP
ncbi:MAG: DUF4129 domain-containing protein [Bacillati bacterium ANGP1]|uniref:DUF4129 domain-containing protein n=1 Tax=Candidatus Segetimicrobium genomatis TaxID=2569760 RepID=A0A537L0I7_9BACT|nr:MAG: DUF4129 domain-containing protein [Terrabacteria group bacterium ANGP1]